MATVATKRLTTEEFFAWVNRPENRDKEYELVRGEIVAMTKPGKRHGLVCSNVVWILINYVRQSKKGYVCSNDTGVIVERNPDTVRGPDIMLFEDADQFQQVDLGFGERPPQLAIEVLSPHDSAGKVMRRVTDQLQFGTPLVWLVDPDAHNVTVYRHGQQPYVVEENQELTAEDILPGFHCRVADFFAMPGQ